MAKHLEHKPTKIQFYCRITTEMRDQIRAHADEAALTLATQGQILLAEALAARAAKTRRAA